jgi:hypothetical protein
MFPPAPTSRQVERDPSGDAKATALQSRGQGLGETGDPVPSIAPTDYVKSYDEGRPRH